MRFIPKRPTLEEIVAEYGGLKSYLDDHEQKKLNQGFDYHDIILLMDVSIGRVALLTGRNKRTIYKWKALREKESNVENA
jgi:hypothetical protein